MILLINLIQEKLFYFQLKILKKQKNMLIEYLSLFNDYTVGANTKVQV